MKRTALFPGSFDPFTRGHESLVRRAAGLFDEVVIGIGKNASKSYLFSLEQRQQYIEKVFADDERIKVVTYEGLTVAYCKKQNIHFIVRGLRNALDLAYEQDIAGMNKTLNGQVETIFLPALPEHSAIHSTIVREIIKSGGDVSAFLPEGVELPTPVR